VQEPISLESSYLGFPATAHFPPEKFSKQSKSEDLVIEKKKVMLSSKDELFAKLRNCNFNAVGPTLKKEAKLISEKFEVCYIIGKVKQNRGVWYVVKTVIVLMKIDHLVHCA